MLNNFTIQFHVLERSYDTIRSIIFHEFIFGSIIIGFRELFSQFEVLPSTRLSLFSTQGLSTKKGKT